MSGFFLSKLLPLFVYPLGMACVLLALALMLGRYRRVQWTLIALSLAVLWLGGNRLVTMAAVRSLEWRYLPQGEIPAAEVIVVLGGGERPRTPPRPIHEINEAGDRLLYAAYLYKTGKAPHILLSGGTPVWYLGLPSARRVINCHRLYPTTYLHFHDSYIKIDRQRICPDVG
jgi:uncharacterized SAM-binding protein YcdF (DUF218 family)